MAYLMRYGRQPIGAILRLPTDIAEPIQLAISRMVARENGTEK